MSTAPRDRRNFLVDQMRNMSATIERQRRGFTPGESALFGSFEVEAHRLADCQAADDAHNAELDLLPHQVPGARRYSINRALCRLLDGKVVDGLEAEVSLEVERRYARKNAVTKGGSGVHVPWDVMVSSRALDTTAGAGAIIPKFDRPIIDVLRSKLVVARLGARIAEDLRGFGSLNMPRKTATVALTYVAESAGPPAQSNMTIPSSVNISPTTLGAFTDMSRRYASVTPDAESLVIDDILTSIAVEVDRAALNGSGTANAPLGIFQNSLIPSFPMGPNGLAPTYASVVAIEAAVANANGDVGRMGFVTSPNGRSVLRRTPKAAGGWMVWDDDNLILGYPAEATTNVPSNLTHGTGTGLSPCCMGNFDDLVVGFWGPPTIIINKFLQSTSGFIRVTVLLDFGCAVRHEASFAIIPDMITT
jgi:HK97 family phage major capsid protein